MTIARLRTCGLWFLFLVAIGAVVPGCASCCHRCSWCCPWRKEEPPVPVSKVETWWDNRVHVTSDPANRGMPLPGLAGRVYLFGGEKNSALDAQGTIVAELYDMTQVATGGQPRRLADWTFPAESLKPLKRTDMIADGYTLFLPWDRYTPDVKKVKVQLAYMPPKGAPHYSDPTVMTLAPAEQIQLQNRQQVIPVQNPPTNK